MANITRIKASDSGKPKKDIKESGAKPEKPVKQPKKAEPTAKSAKKESKTGKKPFILIRPLVYFGRYLRDSWREIRQVRWPSRKATWKLFFAILIYTLLFGAIIMLLDVFFTWIFNTII
ncbi:preprotein translocase subunit SecE [Candidatus Saccharibacteria bacterium]|nr:preprotein translocase subunit SecE [Candidatus Saccharibacteria bacterium]